MARLTREDKRRQRRTAMFAERAQRHGRLAAAVDRFRTAVRRLNADRAEAVTDDLAELIENRAREVETNG